MGRRKKSRQRLFQPARRQNSGAHGLTWSLLVLVLVLGWMGTPDERRPRLSRVAELLPLEFRAGVQRAAVRVRGRLRTVFGGALDSAAEQDETPVELWLDPAELDGTWLAGHDPRWSEELHASLLETSPFDLARVQESELLGILGDLKQRLEGLSFVKSVPVCRVPRGFGVTGSTGATDGATDGGNASPVLELELELRVPVACVPVGHNFYGVDAEGVLLSGSWPVPLQWEDLPLPVIGPIEDGTGLFALARPGDWLLEPEHTDALEVALSLAEHLDSSRRGELGHLVIDATGARRASVTDSGIELLLGGQRLILFGRSPRTDEPGELAVGRKWDAVRRVLSDRWQDWEVLDVRWDQPELRLRGPVLASALDGYAFGTPR